MFYTLPECVIPNPRSKTYLRKNLAKTLAIMDMLKHVRYAEGCTILVLPTTSRKLKSICGSQQGVSDMIRFMKRIGLISTESDDYQFNAYYDNDNRCKTYRYYVENEKKIREYCIANKINTFIVQNNQAIKPYRKADELDAFPKSSVIFSSHLHLLKPENWSKKQFEDYLMEVLYENYPSLSYF